MLIEHSYDILALKMRSMTYSEKMNEIMEKNSNNSVKPWMISRLKYHSLVILDSIHDNSSKEIEQFFVKQFSSLLWKKMLVDLYKKLTYQKYFNYTTSQFNHHLIPIDQMIKFDSKHEKRLERIIEKGFLINKFLRKYTNLEVKQYDYIENLYEQSDFMFKQAAQAFSDLISCFRRQKKKFNQEITFEEAYQFFYNHQKCVEIFDGERLQIVYFTILPHFFGLSPSTMRTFQKSIKRTSLATKHDSLIDNIDEINEKMHFHSKFNVLCAENRTINFLTRNVKFWKSISFILCVVENLILLIESPYEDFGLQIFNQKKSWRTIIEIFQIAQIILTSFVLLVFIFKGAPLLIHKAQKEIKQDEEKNNNYDIFRQQDTVQNQTKSSKIKNTFIYLKYFSQDSELIYFTVYTAIVVLGLYIDIFIALMLIDIFFRFPQLQKVVKAVYAPRYNLLLVFVLFLIFIYYFGVISYTFFQEEYFPVCQDLLTCTSVVFSQTFKRRLSGIVKATIGDYTKLVDGPNGQKVKYSDYKLNSEDMLDLAFVLIVLNLLWAWTFSALIIESYTSYKNQEKEIIKDQENICIICGLSREEIDKLHKKGFAWHTKNEHNMYNFLLFFCYLKEKNPSDYTRVEKLVSSKLMNKDISFFPKGRCLSFK